MTGSNRISTAISLLNALLAKSDAKDGEYTLYRDGVRILGATLQSRRIIAVTQDLEGEQHTIFEDIHNGRQDKIESGG